VFLIDGKEYPDPDPSLPITGTRSVQAMYRDYFPGQLDNADVVQKTRQDGTLEVTFKRRIGTKGARGRSSTRVSSELVVDVRQVTTLLAGLAEDRPLAWDLVEQAIGPGGKVRLDYVPDASQLNLAEAQLTARTRLIDLAVCELSRLRPCT
jgi:PRTRC genetic system protein C